MESLKEKIMAEGQAIGTDILRVDRFLNHQIDVQFMEDIGIEFRNRFGDCEITKVLTVESSGIVIACETAKRFGYVPVLFAKKGAPNTIVEGSYCAPAKSFTKGIVSTLRVSKKYLGPEDRVLIIDDFLAYGEAAAALCELCRQAGARVVGIGAVIEKEFQGGAKRLKEKGYRVESLAIIEKISEGNIVFK